MAESLVSLKSADLFQQDQMILSQVDIELFENEFVYIIGKTGSGKSTLLRTLYGDLPLKTGEGKVENFDLVSLKPKQIPFLRRKLGIIFQDFQLLTDRTVSENLKFVLKATGWKSEELITKRIDEVLELVGIKTKGFKFPFELSGGEQQRVSIARALMNDPRVILADEPTGNLDPDTSRDIIELLFRIKESGACVFMATHNYKIIENFPARIIKIVDGKITEISAS